MRPSRTVHMGTMRGLMTALDHVRTIVAQHRYRQSLPNPYRDKLGDLKWPAMIRAPSGREIILDSEILAAIHDLADCLRKVDPDLDRFVSNGEWLKLVKTRVAYALDASSPKPDLDAIANHVLEDVMSSLALDKAGLGHFEFSFGCTLFEGIAPRPFCIGPVRFETRLDWLERKFAEGAISDPIRRRVQRAWEGHKLNKRKRSADSEHERTILGLSHDASFICSVSTNGMAHEFGRQRARTTARLALATIALLWQKASATLGKMNLVEDRVVRILHELTFLDGQLPFGGGRKSHIPGGQRLKADEWDKLRSDFTGHFTVVGDLLKSIVDTTKPPRCPRATHALTHALLWFHQGCREDEPVIAIVNFATTLDCLASGGGQESIKDLIKAHLGVDAAKPLWVRGDQTAEEAVKEIYDHARNATIHGRIDHPKKPDSKPFHDWCPVRDRAEILARDCLRACIDWTAQHPDSDNPATWLTS